MNAVSTFFRAPVEKLAISGRLSEAGRAWGLPAPTATVTFYGSHAGRMLPYVVPTRVVRTWLDAATGALHIEFAVEQADIVTAEADRRV